MKVMQIELPLSSIGLILIIKLCHHYWDLFNNWKFMSECRGGFHIPKAVLAAAIATPTPMFVPTSHSQDPPYFETKDRRVAVLVAEEISRSSSVWVFFPLSFLYNT